MKIATLKSKHISGNTFYNDITIKIKLLIIKISLGPFFGIKDFDKLSQEVVEKLILKLAYKDRATETIAYTTRINFDKLSKEFRESLFVKLADIGNAIVDVANPIHRHFDTLSTDLREKLLVKLADRDTAAGEADDALLYHFENLSEEVKLNLNIREQLEQKLSSFYKVS